MNPLGVFRAFVTVGVDPEIMGIGHCRRSQKLLAKTLVAIASPRASKIKISQIRILSTERIGRRLARASDSEMNRVIEGLNEILGAV